MILYRFWRDYRRVLPCLEPGYGGGGASCCPLEEIACSYVGRPGGSSTSKGGRDVGERTGCLETSSNLRIIKEALLLGRPRMELARRLRSPLHLAWHKYHIKTQMTTSTTAEQISPTRSAVTSTLAGFLSFVYSFQKAS